MLIDLVKKNRSYRGYDKVRQVTRAELENMVNCARLSASSVNIQPFQYYLVYKKDEVEQMHPLVRWARALPELELPHEGMDPAAYIIICQDTRLAESVPRFQKDVGIAAQTILLAATEMG